jgi:hypothetical protein
MVVDGTIWSVRVDTALGGTGTGFEAIAVAGAADVLVV